VNAVEVQLDGVRGTRSTTSATELTPITTSCVLFTDWKNKKGYGQRWFRGRRIGAHRAAWIETHGPIPKGLEVNHWRCFQPACINVEHLRLATRRNNAKN